MASTMKPIIRSSDAGLLIMSMKVLAVNMANRTPILMNNIMPTIISKITRRMMNTVLMKSPFSMGPCRNSVNSNIAS